MDEREKALRLTAGALEKRLEGLNELRRDVVNDRELFLTKSAYNAQYNALQMRVDKIETVQVTQATAQSKMVGIGIGLMVLSWVAGAIVGVILEKVWK